MPDDPKPATTNEVRKPVRFILPRNVSAAEAARLVQELLAKHGHGKPVGDGDANDLVDGRRSKDA